MRILKWALLLCPLVLFPAVSQAQTFVVQLTGPNEAPANASPGLGTGVVIFDTTAHTMFIDVSFRGLIGNTTAAHIHAATALPGLGTAGVATQTPTFAGFPAGVTAGSYTNTFNMTLAGSYNAAFITANGGTPASAEAALVAAATSGKAYLNIHSTAFPGGEIRGFLATAPEPGAGALVALGLSMSAVAYRRKRA